MKVGLSWVVAFALLLIPVAAAMATIEALGRYELAVMPWKRDPGVVFVDVPPGARASDAVKALVDAGVLRDARTARLILERSDKTRGIHAGEYRFERALTPVEVLQRLIAGRVFLRRITFPEGLHRFELARRFAATGFGSEADFLDASASPGLIVDLDERATDLEGYLFPDTYTLGRSDGARVLVERMVQGFRKAVGPEARARADGIGMTLREVVILASLVEKETARADERELVAAVYHERLRRGMLMQADPTVIYGLIREGRFDGNLTRAHLREPGPYNTYARAGLPPGPIANPGKAALDAAFAPAAADYLYFVSRNDGSHAFSRTLAEHNRMVEQYQRRYWREKWAKRR